MKNILSFFIILSIFNNVNTGLWQWIFGQSHRTEEIKAIKAITKNVKPHIDANRNTGNVNTFNPVVNVNPQISVATDSAKVRPEPIVNQESMIDTTRIQKIIHEQKETVIKNINGASSWVRRHKFLTLVGSIAGYYLGIMGYIKYLESKLQSSQCWSLWLKHHTLEDLYLIPQDKFATDLLKSIQNVYTSISDPTDFVTPLTKFIKDTEDETITLKRYLKLIGYSDRPYIKRVVLFNQDLVKVASTRLTKLNFIKNSFLTWLSNYKLDQQK